MKRASIVVLVFAIAVCLPFVACDSKSALYGRLEDWSEIVFDSNDAYLKAEPYEDGAEIVGIDERFQFAKSLTIPEKIQVVDASGKTVEKPVVRIGDRALRYMQDLKKLTLPETLREIGDEAFSSARVEELNLPDGVKKIGKRAFSYLRVEKLRLPEGLEELGDGAFASAMNLYSFDVPESSERFKSVGGVLMSKDGERLIAYPAGRKAISYDVPDSVVEIAGDAFWNARTLAEVRFGANVKSIGESAFFGCEKLERITLPDGLTEIPNGLFNACRNIEDVRIPNSVTRIGDEAFFGCAALDYVKLPEGLREIGVAAFAACRNLDEIALPDGLEKIGDRAFQHTKLFKIETPSSVREIGKQALNVRTLYAIKLNDGLVKIGARAFEGSEIESIRIPASVEELGEGAFFACPKLKSVEIAPENERYTSENGFVASKDGKVLHYVPVASIQAKLQLDDYEIKEIAPYAFAKAGNLVSLRLPDSVETIGNDAFLFCDSTTYFVAPKSLKTVGDRAFNNCGALSTVQFDEGLETIGSGAFSQCKSLSKINFPDSLKSIGTSAFAMCDSLKEVELPEDVLIPEKNLPPNPTKKDGIVRRAFPDVVKITYRPKKTAR